MRGHRVLRSILHEIIGSLFPGEALLYKENLALLFGIYLLLQLLDAYRILFFLWGKRPSRLHPVVATLDYSEWSLTLFVDVAAADLLDHLKHFSHGGTGHY